VCLCVSVCEAVATTTAWKMAEYGWGDTSGFTGTPSFTDLFLLDL